jgi:hypothetical protein
VEGVAEQHPFNPDELLAGKSLPVQRQHGRSGGKVYLVCGPSLFTDVIQKDQALGMFFDFSYKIERVDRARIQHQDVWAQAFHLDGKGLTIIVGG